MQMQSCRLLWHQSTLSIVLRRELADCTASRQIPVLYVKRPGIFGGDLEIELCGSAHPVRMLPVSGKEVRNLCFGLVYGPKRKRVRFRARDVATYDKWEMVLEVAVEKAAADRPTFLVWPMSSTSPSLSLLDDGGVSEDFSFNDVDGCDESKVLDHRCKAQQMSQKRLSGPIVDFVDPSFAKKSLSDQDETEEEADPPFSFDSEEEAFAFDIEGARPSDQKVVQWAQTENFQDIFRRDYCMWIGGGVFLTETRDILTRV